MTTFGDVSMNGRDVGKPASESPADSRAESFSVHRWRNLLVLLGVILFASAPVAFLDASAQTLLLKVFLIIFLTLLPGWLYLQFVLVKRDDLYDEYVLNLYRLRIDNVANLPQPPLASECWAAWNAERQKRPQADNAENIYLTKFEAVYGKLAVPDERRWVPGDQRRTRRDLRSTVHLPSTTIAPVVWATALFCVGWIAVLQPEAFHVGPILWKVSLSGLPVVPASALRFAFVGAYAFLLQGAVRRYFQSDLKTHFFIGAIARIVLVALIVVAADQVWPSTRTAENAFAFFLGFFPLLGLQLIQRALAVVLGGFVPAIEESYPLSQLDGLNIWWQARLMEEGVEGMQQLATANLVDLMLHTRMPVTRMVDWVDQSFLYLVVDDTDVVTGGATTNPRQTLRALGIRTATNLLDAFDNKDDTSTDFTDRLATVLRKDPDGPSPLECIRRTLSCEVNLWHIRQWKRHDWLDEKAAAPPIWTRGTDGTARPGDESHASTGPASGAEPNGSGRLPNARREPAAPPSWSSSDAHRQPEEGRPAEQPVAADRPDDRQFLRRTWIDRGRRWWQRLTDPTHLSRAS